MRHTPCKHLFNFYRRLKIAYLSSSGKLALTKICFGSSPSVARLVAISSLPWSFFGPVVDQSMIIININSLPTNSKLWGLDLRIGSNRLLQAVDCISISQTDFSQRVPPSTRHVLVVYRYYLESRG